MNYLVIGADQAGHAVVYDLVRSQHVDQILLADNDPQKITRIIEQIADDKIVPCQIDLNNPEQVVGLMHSCDVAISTIASSANYELSKMALQAGCNFCDMGDDEEIARMQFLLNDLAKQKNIAIVPGCGVTPGMVSILATNAMATLEQSYDVHIRVGAIPAEPNIGFVTLPAFSIDRLVNDLVEDSTQVRNGKLLRVPALAEVETIAIAAPFNELEAFNTSGGMSRFATSLASKVDNFGFTTIHYPGFCHQMRLLKHIGLLDSEPITLASGTISPRELISHLLAQKGTKSEPDVMLVQIIVRGAKEGRDVEITWQSIDYMDQAIGLSAANRMRAFPTSIMAQMVGRQDIADKGTLAQEEVASIKIYLAELASRGIRLTMNEIDLSPEATQIVEKK